MKRTKNTVLVRPYNLGGNRVGVNICKVAEGQPVLLGSADMVMVKGVSILDIDTPRVEAELRLTGGFAPALGMVPEGRQWKGVGEALEAVTGCPDNLFPGAGFVPGEALAVGKDGRLHYPDGRAVGGGMVLLSGEGFFALDYRPGFFEAIDRREAETV